MNCLEYTNYYFIGIGGIGMSSLAEYMLHLNKKVEGYDREKLKNARCEQGKNNRQPCDY